MVEIDLGQKFPEMRPIGSLPILGTVFGFGFSLHGERDHDEETQTHVTTYWLCALFVPILALRAYRVAWDEFHCYVLGREPLSGLARFWNLLVVVAALCLGSVGAWNAYTSSPEYLAGRKIAQADRAAQAGDYVEAAKLYFEVATGQTRHASEAVERIKGLLDRPDQLASPEDAAAIWQIAVQLQQQGRWPDTGARLLEQALALVERHAEADPRGALAVLESVTPLAEDADGLTALRQPLLERIVARQPGDTEAASLLAVLYETQGELSKCEPLLTPHVHRLGDTEGARILGQIWARQGKFDESHSLLVPYCEMRLEKLHAAEKDYTNTVSEAQERVLDQLSSGEAPGFSYEIARGATEAEQNAMVQEYVQSRLKDDPGIRKAQEAMLKSAGVVPVALDLGMVILRRAQDQDDPEVRRAELERAEKTFLAVRGLAGETDQYRLNLGQVYYWLGKHDQGRQLFDELLQAQNRSYEILIGVSRLLRQVGAKSEARLLVEEAYNNEQDQAKRYQAALDRAAMFVDVDDAITWLRRANPADFVVQAELGTALGNRAIRDGQEQEAVLHLREAIGLYNRMTETPGALNNCAGAHVSLYRITGDRQELRQAVTMYEKAVAFAPDDSLPLSNLAGWTLEEALSEIIGDRIDLKALKTAAGLDLLAYLYEDQSGKNAHVERVRSSDDVAKTLAYLDRLFLLAPKRADAYAT
ncbi:MAG: tetratricopeptide repeat protein, partial [Planctomycetota bacterium]